MRVYYLFIDGIGLGQNGSENPFHLYSRSSLSLLTGTATDAIARSLCFKATDAHMGISGLPQSATGQTSLWTGMNGPVLMQRHYNAFPGPTLIPVIKEHSIIKRFKENKRQATLINAYTDQYLSRIEKKPRLSSVSTHIQRASGQPLKSMDDLSANNALYMDITHQIMHRIYPELEEYHPVQDARQRGRDFIHIGKNYDLTIFEYFLTDKAGHSQSFEDARFTIECLEEFIRGIFDELNPAEDLLLITSDHGNMEDLSIKTHTNNLVPTMTYGWNARNFQQVESLMDIPQQIYNIFDIPIPVEASRKETIEKTAAARVAASKPGIN